MKQKIILATLFLTSSSVFSAIDEKPSECEKYLREVILSSDSAVISDAMKKDIASEKKHLIIKVSSQDAIILQASAYVVEHNSLTADDEPINYFSYNHEDFLLDEKHGNQNGKSISFDMRPAKAYANCLNNIPVYQVTGEGRLYFHETNLLSEKTTSTFIVPSEYVELISTTNDVAKVKYTSRLGDVFEGWVELSRLKKQE